MCFKGIFPVADRDFILLTRYELEKDDSLYWDASVSINYPYPSEKGTVRGDIMMSGFIVEKTG